MRRAGVTLLRTTNRTLRARAPLGVMTAERKAQISACKAELLELLTQEHDGQAARRQSVLDLLEEDPAVHYAWLIDAEAHADRVIVALALRGVATCELDIPRAQYDPFRLLECIGVPS